MTHYLLLIVFLFPMLGTLAARSSLAPGVAVLAAAVALLSGLYLPEGTGLELGWVLMGMELGLSTTDKWFLAAAGIIWFSASIYAWFSTAEDPRRHRFWLFFLLAMSGNFALIVGQDLIMFYLGFTVMGLASYGLVIHNNSEKARYAGKVYLIMTLLAEFALFAAFVLLQGGTTQVLALAMQLLLVLAFGVKAGLFGLHMWLPLAHPAAPVPASAVLSGAMIKAALIGWMRFLPLGEEILPIPGLLLLVLGSAGIVLGSIFGVLQTQTKTVLAYSSIAKMGLMSAALGVAALEPQLAPGIAFAVAVFALHHGLVKAALFLTTGIGQAVDRKWLWLTVVPIASMLGLPYTSGSSAKSILKSSLGTSDTYWSAILLVVMTIALIGSVLLMARFIILLLKEGGHNRPMLQPILLPWLLLIFSSTALVAFLGPGSFNVTDVIVIMLSGAAYWLAVRVPWINCPPVPAGDILILFQRLTRTLQYLSGSLASKCRLLSLPSLDMHQLEHTLAMIELRFSTARVAALLWFMVLLFLLFLPFKGQF